MTSKKMNAIMSSWMGHNANDLIAAWGPPAATMSDGSGGQIFIYDQSGQVVLPGTSTTTANYTGTANATYNQFGNVGTANANAYGTANATTTYHPPTVIPINRKRMFWVNQRGEIYRWSWQGL
jgi:hypothetical protein